MGHLFEVEAGRLALRKAKSDAVKRFATTMVDDHAAASLKLKQAVATDKAPLAPVTKLDSAHQKMIEQLEAANGDSFDRRYIQLQLKAHRKAVELHRGYAKSGDQAALKDFASQVAPVIESHLAQLQKMPGAGRGS